MGDKGKRAYEPVRFSRHRDSGRLARLFTTSPFHPTLDFPSRARRVPTALKHLILIARGGNAVFFFTSGFSVGST